MQNLVIVESPTKARTLGKFLGDKYQVEASMGHIRDLPKSKLGINIEDNFEPEYIIPRDKIKKVNELKKVAAGAKTLWLATDPDREGEAIAWHLQELLTGVEAKSKKLKAKNGKEFDIKRVEFHEITPEAVKEAFDNPRPLNLKLVDAQQARRVLDRLVGYKLSPVLWKKVKSGLSAGRVQSVALRLIVEREREVKAFKPQEYWTIEARLESGKKDEFLAEVVEFKGKKFAVKNKTEADNHLEALKKADYQILKITKKEVKKHPSPPFTTSTLQQVASNRLGLSAKKTMMIAQTLYEHGLITYMRTDSLNLSVQAVNSMRQFIETSIGKNYLPEKAKLYKTKSKLAQEAHEAIRPTNIQRTAEQLKMMEGMTRDHVRLYDLIWKRALASQMAEAVSDQTTVEIKAQTGADFYSLRSHGSVIKFEGWLKLFGVSHDAKAKNQEEEAEDNEKEQFLPE
jgi:DNA topoisomerase I